MPERSENTYNEGSEQDFEDLFNEVQSILDSIDSQQQIDPVDEAVEVIENSTLKEEVHNQMTGIIDKIMARLQSNLDSDTRADYDRQFFKDAMDHYQIILQKERNNQYIPLAEYHQVASLLQKTLDSKGHTRVRITDSTQEVQSGEKICAHCGAAIPKHSVFCGSCGQKV